jgi:hypothetical protein
MQPTDVALGLLFAQWLTLAGWGLVAYGVALVVGGLAAIVYMIATWGGVTLGPDPVMPAVEQPTVPIPRPPKAHLRIEDAETRAIPGIPGATPPVVEEFIAAVDEATRALAEAAQPPAQMLATAWETFEQIPGLRVIPSAGPVCPTCGGPFGNCQCYSQKSAPKEEQTQVVDLCPLTTQDIVIPDEAEAPVAEQVAEHRNRHRETQELSGHMAAIEARERVA